MSFNLHEVTYGYRPGESVLSQVNLDIIPGSTTAVLGASGSGKSTLLYLLGLLWDGGLNGRIVYHRGDEAISYDGLNPASAASLRLTDFGFVLQSSYMLPHFTCAQNAAMPLSLLGRDRPESSRILRELVDAVDDGGGLAAVLGNPAGQVSGGQRQRFAVVRAVVHDPRVVFADEPFSSLDEANTERTLDLLAAWQRGEAPGQGDRSKVRTLLLVCHDLAIAYARADWFVFVTKEGRVLGNRAYDRDRFSGPEALQEIIRSGKLPGDSEHLDNLAQVREEVA